MSAFALSRTQTRRSTFPGPHFPALARAVARAWSEARALRAMQSLDDAMLADIGVGRSEIEDAVRHGRPFRARP